MYESPMIIKVGEQEGESVTICGDPMSFDDCIAYCGNGSAYCVFVGGYFGCASDMGFCMPPSLYN